MRLFVALIGALLIVGVCLLHAHQGRGGLVVLPYELVRNEANGKRAVSARFAEKWMCETLVWPCAEQPEKPRAVCVCEGPR